MSAVLSLATRETADKPSAGAKLEDKGHWDLLPSSCTRPLAGGHWPSVPWPMGTCIGMPII